MTTLKHCPVSINIQSPKILSLIFVRRIDVSLLRLPSQSWEFINKVQVHFAPFLMFVLVREYSISVH